MSYFDAPLAFGKTLVDPLSGISISVVDISPLGALVRLALPGSPPTADTTPPSQPAGLVTTTVDSSSVGLAWTASTDNVGVTGYRVYRNSRARRDGDVARLHRLRPFGGDDVRLRGRRLRCGRQLEHRDRPVGDDERRATASGHYHNDDDDHDDHHNHDDNDARSAR